MRSVISSATGNLVVDGQRAAVDLGLGQGSEHCGQLHRPLGGVGQHPLGSATPVAAEPAPVAGRVDLELLRPEHELDPLAGPRARDGVAAALEREQPVARDGALGALRDQVRLRRKSEQCSAVAQYGDGDGYCSADEVRFKSWKGRQKLECARDELGRVAFAALAQLLGRGDPDPAAARRVGERITADHGYLPVAVGRALCYAARALEAKRPGREAPETARAAVPGPTHALADTPDTKSPADELAYWQRKGRYGDEAVRSLGELVCCEGAIETLSPQQVGELAFLLECAVRGRVSKRLLESWLAQLREAGDRRAAAEALRTRLVEKTNEVEPGGRREAA
jgi:hypothetical protein